jgi:short-subunit dehydrogenase
VRTRWETALVTGASSGLGAAIARRLAAGGARHLTLTGRDGERLQALSAELRAQGACDIEPVVCDLTVPAQADGLAARLTAHPPDLLVNNAGAGHFGRFATIPFADLAASLDLNVRALVQLTHAYCRTAPARGGGDVLQVASAVAFVPVPYEAVYAASKAFVVHFSEALAEELRGTPVRIRCVCPGLIATEFATRAGLARRVVPVARAESAAVIAAAALAVFERAGVTHGVGPGMRAAVPALRCVPQRLTTRIAARWLRRGLAD